ncbi:N-acetyldiaminopimelate deacetylase [bioreactor metagenome]|uniref:N-acetyldiaminopimelate deacetylase n=1 Tax=bioreactor metagenome TaxID=1076179 RepID=A0A645I9E5_9ZZZZ
MAVLTLGKISGGEAQNVICEDVEINGTIRTLNDESKKLIVDRAKTIVENTANAYRCEGNIYMENQGYPPVINDKELVDIIKFNTEKLLGKEAYKEKMYPSMGAEDFSFYTENCKGVFFHLGCGNKEKSINSLIHTDTFDIDEECLFIGSAMHVLNVLYFNH